MDKIVEGYNMYIYLKCILLITLVFASICNAQQFGGVVRFNGAIVQGPCKLNVVSESIINSSCIFNKGVMTQNISFNTTKNNTKQLSMFKLKTQKLKNNKNGLILQIDYM